MNSVRRGTGDRPSRFDHLATPLCEAVAVLRAGVARGDPLLLLTGPDGTGKTTVARRLLEELEPQRHALGGIFGSYGEGDALMSLVVQDLGVRLQVPGDAFLTLEQFLRRGDNAGREAVLVIDEVHALDANALRQLWQLAAPPAGGQPRLQVVLVAQQLPDAVTELIRGGRALPIGTRCHLRALEAAETREFVLNRIRSGDGIGQPEFGNDALDAIHQCSGGVLRRINLLCDRILMFLAMEGRREVSAQVVAAVDAQLRGELRGPGLPAREPVSSVVQDQTEATRSTAREVAAPVSTFGAQSRPSAATPSDPNGAERAAAPAGPAAPRAISWHAPWQALRQGRLPARLLAGLLLLFSFALLGLTLPWSCRATMPTPALDPARGDGQQSTVASPAASAVASTAASPRSESGPPPQFANTAAASTGSATTQPPTPASAPCSGPADTLGLCAPVTPALPTARGDAIASAPIAPRTEPAPCRPERAALGLCNTP